MEELSYFYRPSLRAVYPRLCWSRAACGGALAVPGLPVPGGVTPTGHACGGGCAAPLCKAPAHEGQHPGVRAVRSGACRRAVATGVGPVFAAMEEMLGPELFVRLRGDWRAGQAQEVLADHARRVWVAETGGEPIGFVAATLHRDSGAGEIYMIAVDPGAQGQGSARP